ncbi:septum formation initiator family protein [candidate division WWE3 bacterium]|jgi:cell division protein FtsB|uniref:Septum formation initiator family protein n=1 Tax=candidate division WWE3 bacterium TaxID=2053526 RepID=A0A3A4ZD08_UNCKA|nr:MAG: septum formation initiator family protein [candidate division WWE3 bacterium]
MYGVASIKYIALSVLLVIASVNFTKTTLEIIKSSQRLDDLRDEVSLMEQEKNDLEGSVEFKKSDEYVEEKARNDLNLAKPGEKLFVVKDKGEPQKARDTDEPEDSSVLSAFDKLEKQSDSDKKENNLYLWYRLFF